MKSTFGFFCALVSLGLCTSTLASCGSGNMFEKLEKKSATDEGTSLLEKGDYDGAIAALNKRLESDPNDTEALSLVASAYAKKAGVDAFKIAASIDAAKGGTTSDFQAIANGLPAGNAANVASLESAVGALERIPESSRTADQNYQLAVCQASLAVTIAKSSAGDSSGQIDKTKVDTISDTDAVKMTEALKGATSALAATDATNAGAASKLSGLSAKIDAEPGASEAERLRSYLKR